MISCFLSCVVLLNICHMTFGDYSRRFPEDLMFGAATASYQIEGAWNVDGKSESIWDHLTHTRPHLVADGSNGDVAADSYRLYKRDLEMVSELGLDFYRFSLSWPRILPNGLSNEINEAAVDHYRKIIDGLLENNIQPVITVYHWDLPQKLQDLGGWTNPYIIDWYSEYARVAFSLFGDRVKYWITLNQPHHICYNGYGSRLQAPALDIKGIGEYLCMKNVLLAHATAFHIYDREFRPTQKGNIFISLSAQWYEPATAGDADAARDANLFYWEIYAHAIYSKEGDFPAIIKDRIAAKSASQRFSKSRLPQFTPEEVELVRGSADYIGINHYSTFYVYRNESVDEEYESPSFMDDLGVKLYQLPEWQIGESNFTMVVPWGFYKLLTRIRENYNNPPVFISENGFASHGGLNDTDRVIYYKTYLSALLDTVEEGSTIRAYAAWSLMDNFEWLHGYSERFGLYEVDYTSPHRTRRPRKSAYFYKHTLKTRTLDINYEPKICLPTDHQLLNNWPSANRTRARRVPYRYRAKIGKKCVSCMVNNKLFILI